jgi:hypothetical protein
VAVESLHGDAVGGSVEHHLLVGAGEGGERDVLVGGVHGEDLVERHIFWPALHRPDRPADGDVNLQGAQAVPQLVPAGGGDGQIQQVVRHVHPPRMERKPLVSVS